ncbi:DUF982 domain-containing protein [Rhizobium leucaenae]|uniref:DUF982 domain-containing protein n=1 Tax=Rhizobium leucaenae TaxID=29450 RepID=UPI00048B7A45
MTTARTFKPLHLQLHGTGKYRHVNTVLGASECLMDRWPVSEGVAFEKALMACLDGMHDRVGGEVVRAALIEAAREAGVGVIE